jgi:hypothetical protein
MKASFLLALHEGIGWQTMARDLSFNLRVALSHLATTY